YVIAGVVGGVHAPIDGEKIHLVGVHTGYGELRKIAIDGAVRVAAMAPVGAVYTFIALVTGAAWGKPMWGTWWVWDARLTSELV
ncbi:cytochrome c biogenesis protein CcsA, partial [Salmonella enterica subsp. enterica serovar Kentucky]|nr:cytochrome c biogenesis protein CcsA [Salmonella enterica subsp. enterica serovar Kentucky]